MTWATIAAVGPPVRDATNPTAQTIAMLRAAMARAMPTAPPNRRTGRATTSNSSGPGWLTSTPELIDADDQVPSSGWLRVNTSSARNSIRALSPIAS